jgi:hypothetical protein
MKFTDKAIEIYTQHCKKKAVKVNGIDHISIHDAINALSIASDGFLADGSIRQASIEILTKVSKGELTPEEADKKLLSLVDVSNSFKVFVTYADNGNVIFSIFDHELIVRNIASIDDFTRGLNELLKQNDC